MTDILDLRSITRRSDKLITRVDLCPKYDDRVPWIIAGECRLEKISEREPRWAIRSYLNNATDVEHDSASAFGIDLIALQFDSSRYGFSTFSAFIDPQSGDRTADGFRVPEPGYNPLIDKETYECKECEEKHLIVRNYYPPANLKLHKLLRGSRVEITIGVVVDET